MHEEIILASGGCLLKSDKIVQCHLAFTVKSIQRTKTKGLEGDGIFYVRLFGS